MNIARIPPEGERRLESWRRFTPVAPDLRVLAFIVVMAGIPSLFRVIHMAENGYTWLLVDLRGVAADWGTGIAVALLLLVVLRSSLIMSAAAALLWLALNAAYYEFLRMFGSPFALAHARYLGDPQFLEGSALAPTHPVLVAVLAAAMIGKVAIGWPIRRQTRPVVVLPLAAIIAALPHLIPGSIQLSEWRQSDLVSINLADAWSRASQGDLAALAAAGEAPMPEGLRADLDAPRWLQASGRPNVLLVFIEGVSAGHVPAIAATAGIGSTIEMPRLSEMTKGAIAFTRFVTQQNQSNRGLYAALCGDIPELARVIPKMSRIANGLPRPCLPSLLRDAGYRSIFLKSAESNFMQMREFGLKVGFDVVYGEEGAPPGLPRGPWGLSDDALYSVALQEIEAMEGEDAPWFMTLFTSGTHHPFALPPGAVADGETDRARAWDFADRSIEAFMQALDARGVLDDTLVLITSDEASFVKDPGGRTEEYLYSLPENWGFVIAFAPGASPTSVEEYFTQADLPLSVLDYLGLHDNEGRFTGRSMFRRYDRSREIAFGAVYHRRVYLFDSASGELALCDEQLTACRLYGDAHRDLFSPKMRFLADLPAVPDRVKAYQAYSLTLPEHRSRQNVPNERAVHLDDGRILSLRP